MAKESSTAEKTAVFSKAQILQSKRYANRRDLLTAVLSEDITYTDKEIESKINEYMKGKVK